MKELKEIDYNYIVDLTKFFITKYRDGELKDLNMVINNVKSRSNSVKEMSFVFDETIWPPDEHEWYRDLIQFNVQLLNDLSYLPFRLFISKGMDQEPILLIKTCY